MRQYLPYILYALIVIGLIAAIVFAFNAKDPASETQKKPATTQQQKEQKEAEAKKAGNNSPGSVAQKPQPSYTPPASTPSSQTNQTSQANNNQQLANSGPGEVAALFVAVTLAGTVVFSNYQRRSLTA